MKQPEQGTNEDLSTHNADHAWNGQPIPHFEPMDSQDSGQDAGMQQSEAAGTFMREGTRYGAGPHTIDSRKAQIEAVHYENGAIAAVRLNNGQVVDIATAIGMAEAELIEDVNTGKNREGQKTLRSYPDGNPDNNLSNLPRF